MHILKVSTVNELEEHYNCTKNGAMTNFNWKDVINISVHDEFLGLMRKGIESLYKTNPLIECYVVCSHIA